MDTMDRLSRPTAASLSRVKTGADPVAIAPKSPPRISSIRSKSTASSKSPQTKMKKEAATPQAPVGSVVAPTMAGDQVSVALAAAEVALEEPLVEPTTNGHPANDEAVSTEISIPFEVEQIYAEPAIISKVEINNEVATPSQTLAAAEDGSGINDLADGSQVEEVTPKTNLEDLVNLQETVPAATPSTEEICEIPDEDDK